MTHLSPSSDRFGFQSPLPFYKDHILIGLYPPGKEILIEFYPLGKEILIELYPSGEENAKVSSSHPRLPLCLYSSHQHTQVSHHSRENQVRNRDGGREGG